MVNRINQGAAAMALRDFIGNEDGATTVDWVV
jgi:hypothetical protein